MRHLQGTEEALNIWYGSCVLLCAVLQKAKLQEHCAEGILMQIPSFSSDAVDSNSRLFFWFVLCLFVYFALFCFANISMHLLLWLCCFLLVHCSSYMEKTRQHPREINNHL